MPAEEVQARLAAVEVDDRDAELVHPSVEGREVPAIELEHPAVERDAGGKVRSGDVAAERAHVAAEHRCGLEHGDLEVGVEQPGRGEPARASPDDGHPAPHTSSPVIAAYKRAPVHRVPVKPGNPEEALQKYSPGTDVRQSSRAPPTLSGVSSEP